MRQLQLSKRRFCSVRALVLAIEGLETRRVLCGLPHAVLGDAPVFDPLLERRASANSGSGDAVSIIWTNRDTNSGADDSRFNSTFGANAAAAKAVVDAALADWGRAITSFNRADNTTSLQVKIQMNATGTGFGAGGGPASTGVPADGKPRTGSISLGRGNDTTGDGLGDGGGWYLDPTPTDSSEFTGNTLGAFSGYPASGSAFDLYTAVSLEISHVLGLISGPTGSPFNSYRLTTSGYTTTLSTPDNAEAGSSNTGTRGYFVKFDGPTIDHLMTTNNGGSGGSNWGGPIHTAGSSASVIINGVTYVGAEDSGNAVYDSARYLPNEVVLRILADAYGYSIQDPSTLPNLHSLLNVSTGALSIRGISAGNSSDTISVTQVGSKLRVSVDIGNDVPGTGALPGAGNLPAYVSEYDLSAVTSIRIYGFDGNDIITVDGVRNTTIYGGAGGDTLRVSTVTSGYSVTVDGEGDNDNLYVGNNNNLEAIDGTVSLIGNSGSDTVWIEDRFMSLITPYTLNGNSFSRTGTSTISWSGAEGVRLYTGSAAMNIYVRAVATPTTIQAGNGSDAFYVGNLSNTLDDIDSSLVIEASSGTSDSVTFYDNGYTSPPAYTIGGNTLVRTGMTQATFNGIESFLLYGTGATDEFRVTATGNNCVYYLLGGGNSDRFYIGDGTSGDYLDSIDGQINIDGQAGSGDEVYYLDGSESLARTYTLTENAVSITGVAPIILTSIEDVVVDAGSGSDTFDVTPSTVIESLLDGNSGSDTLIMRTAGTTSPLNTPTTAGNGAWTFGNRQRVSYQSITNFTTPGVNTPPSISSLSVAPGSVAQGQSFTLTANGVTDADGTVDAVYFYRESNGIAGFQADDAGFFTDTSSAGGFGGVLSSSTFAVGTHTLYARALDNGGAFSSAVSATLTVTAGNQPPTIASLSDSIDPVNAGNTFRLTANGVSDPENAVSSVNFFRETNGQAGLQIGSDLILGNDLTAGDGWYFDVNTTGLSAITYTYYAVAIDAASLTSNTVSTTNTVNIPAGPMPYYSTAFLDVPPVRMLYMFLEDVGASLDASDIVVRNLATNQTVPIGAVEWDSANKAATFALATFPPDGNYRATLFGSGVSANGVPMGSNVDVDFFILRGDANRDRRVDFADLLILAQNYGGINKGFHQGNFDLDPERRVDFNDLLLLAQRYGTSLLAAPSATLPMTRTKSRSNLDVLS